MYGGYITGGTFINSSGGGQLHAIYEVDRAPSGGTGCVSTIYTLSIIAACITSNNNLITVENAGNFFDFHGAVECSSQGGNTTQSSSMTGTTTTQDTDGDGIPDASDRCPHTPHIMCFKEAT